jgi:hypothetical protein
LSVVLTCFDWQNGHAGSVAGGTEASFMPIPRPVADCRSSLPSALRPRGRIIEGRSDHVATGHFHLRHGGCGVVAFDARCAAGEQLLRA